MTKPRSRVIMSGAISLPRRRDQFKEAARRRGSYHDAFKEQLSIADRSPENQQNSELYIEPEEKVRNTISKIGTIYFGRRPTCVVWKEMRDKFLCYQF